MASDTSNSNTSLHNYSILNAIYMRVALSSVIWNLYLHVFSVILSFSSTVRFPFASCPGLLSSVLSSALSLSAEDQVWHANIPPLPSMLLCLKDTGIPYVISLRLTCECVCLREFSSSGPSNEWYYTPSPLAGPETRRRDQQTQSMGKQGLLCYQGNQTQFFPISPTRSLPLLVIYTHNIFHMPRRMN